MSSLQFLYSRPPVEGRAVTPLTHHEIMRLVAPFTEAGWRADLAASDRSRRLIAFQPRPMDAVQGLPAVAEHLTVLVGEDGRFELTRRLVAEGVGAAGISASGAVLGELLASVCGVPAIRLWHLVGGVPVARSYEIRSSSSGGVGAGPTLQLQRAQASFAQGSVRLRVEQTLAGAPLEVTLAAADGLALQVPPDFLAVAHPAWRPLRSTRTQGWKGSLRVPAREPQRTPSAEERIDGAVAHVARTLADPPARFHARHAGARWRAALQRATPVLAGSLALLLTPLLMLVPGRSNPAFLVVALQVPTFLLIGFFTLRELPVLEIPPPPRRLTFERWVTPRDG